MLYLTTWIPAAIAGAAAITTSVVNNAAKKKQARRARQQALEDWNRVNEYNHPKNQRKRMQEAGYNPNLFYGQGTVGAAEQVHQTEPFRTEIDHDALFKTGMAAYIGFQQHKAGMDKIQEETEGHRIQNEKERAKLMAELQYYADNAKNYSEKLFYEAEIKRIEKQRVTEAYDAIKSGSFSIKDGKIHVGDQKIKKPGVLNAFEQIQNINSKRESIKLIQEEIENKRLSNKAVKELDKVMKKMMNDGMSFEEALQAATWLVLYKQLK